MLINIKLNFVFFVMCICVVACQKPLKEWECLPIQEAQNPMIHQQERIIVDGEGKPIKLKGVNVGGWLLWEGWVWGSPLALFSMDKQSEKNIGERFAEIVGQQSFLEFQEQIYKHYITEQDVRDIAKLGFNVIRVPINHTILQDDEGVFHPQGFQWLDNIIEWAEKYNVYVIIDMHSAPGGQFAFFVSDPDSELVWDSSVKKQRTIDLWQDIAKRYAKRKIVAGYDLLNEPVPQDNQDLVSLYKEIIAAIRKVDPYHMILLEGSNVAKEFWMFEEPLDANQMYEFHIYNWFGDDRKSRLQRLQEVSQKHCTPIWCGEFGENSYEMLASTQEMFEQESFIVGWALWTWKKISYLNDNQYPYLAGIEASENWHKLIRWACRGEAKPTKEEAQQGIDEFVRILQKRTYKIDSKMVQALGDE